MDKNEARERDFYRDIYFFLYIYIFFIENWKVMIRKVNFIVAWAIWCVH